MPWLLKCSKCETIVPAAECVCGCRFITPPGWTTGRHSKGNKMSHLCPECSPQIEEKVSDEEP